MTRTQALNPDRTWSGICVALLDDGGMARAHAVVFGSEKPTDVISQAYVPLPAVAKGWTGDVLINVERAIREGARRPGGAGRELALYLAHGCQHLSGAGDATPPERRRMRRRENAWLAEPECRKLWQRLMVGVASECAGHELTGTTGHGRRARRRR